MKIIAVTNDTHIIRLDRGDELHGVVSTYCEENAIHGGTFSAIGAAEFLKLAWFEPESKRYEEKDFNGAWEVVSLTGFIALKDGRVHLHVHGCFSNESMETRAGHVVELRVRPTLEIAIRPLKKTLKRLKDDETGLYLLEAD